MRELKRRFWLAVHDALFWIGWRRGALWALDRAGYCVDWGELPKREGDESW